MSKDQISINSAITRELHQLLNQDDMTFIENQFQVKQVLHNGVTKDEFEEIIFDKLPTKVTISSAKLNNIFTKIDAYSTGLINWNGFLTYVLTSLQRDKTATLGNDRALHTEFRVLKGPNNSVILRIDIMPLFDAKTGEIMYSTCRFVTASKDGILAVWTHKWKLQKYKICRDGGSDIVKRKVFPFILDMVCLPNMQMIATCSTDDSIRFYDINNSKMDLLMKLSGIESIATCLDFWFDLNNNEYSILTIGDSAGGVLILEFYKSITERLLGLHGFGTPVIKLSDILQKQNQYIDGTYSPNQHDEWVRKVKYISEFKSILSCAISSTLSMVIFSIVNESEKKIFNVPKGISCFDYSSHHSIIVSGSIDRNLRIWNPYINKKPIATLSGHSAPLIQVIIVDDQFISISLSEDKSIKIWDLTERVCLQTVYDRALKWGNQPVSSAIHDPYHRLLLLGSNKLVVYKRIWKPQTDDRIIFTSHEHPLTGIAYSPVYNYVISAGDNGKIVYWDLETGQRRVKIVQSHAIIVDGNEVPTLITAMSLDGTNSRLFTAGGDGLLKMWLLSNGSFLKSIHIPEGKDINSILVCKMHIFFGGWSKRVNVCHEELHIETLKTWALYHTDDIMEICHIQPNKIATASWDGKIVIWMLETGQMLSIWSLHNEFHFYYMPELKTVAAAQLTEYNFLDFVSLSAAYQKKCVKCHSLEEKCLVHSVLKIQKRKIKHSEFEQLNPSSTEINFPALYCMVTLPTRLQKPSIGNLFVGDTYGFIQLWSVGPKGGFIALFSNVSLLDQYTYCMTTDDENKYLFTGDTSGFIRVWYIKYFYSGENQPSSDELNVETTPFPFSTKRLQLVKERVLRELKILKPKLYFKFATVDAPHLISSFRGHLKPIVKIIVLQKKQVILTASKDKSVRIWTYSGAYLRTLGDTREFSLDLVLSAPIGPMNRKAPADVTKVASGPTLQVIYQGMSPNWYRLREVILRTYIKSLRRKRIENILLKSLSDLRQEDQVKKSRVSVMERRQAQKIKFSQMGAPLGKFYAFKEKRKDNSALPSIPNTYKTMNCVYAYLRNPPLAALSLEAAYKYLDSHRHAARLIMSKSMYEHKTLFR